MKNQALFSLKDKSKKLKCRMLQFLFGALRIKILMINKIENLILKFSCYRTFMSCLFQNERDLILVIIDLPYIASSWI